jgi:outer membrane protein insertion porin family
MKRVALLPFVAAMMAANAYAQSFQPFVVNDIRVDGLQRIAAGTVFTYMPVRTR